MTYRYNPFTTSYPSSRGPIGHIFRPVVEYRTYVRAVHMLLMFPLGIAYFVFFTVSFSLGGALIWTLVGPAILLATLFITRWLGDFEASTAGYANRTPIRRPPSKLEGVSNFRSQVKLRLVDPTTWTGLVYLVAQFPIGIAAFVTLVVMYSVTGAMVFAPLFAMVTDGPHFDFGGHRVVLDTPFKALLLTPFGLVGLILASHVVLAFSSIHGWWARLMLGSRSPRISSLPTPPPTEEDSPGFTPPWGLGVTPPGPGAEVNPDPGPGAMSVAESLNAAIPTTITPADPATGSSSADILALVPDPSETGSEFTPDASALRELTDREQEVFMLMAHGDTNADIAEELFISEGTVKTHVKRVLSKLDMRDRTQVVVFAYEQRLVIPASGDVATSSDVATRRSANGQ